MRELSTLDSAAPIGFVVAWPGPGPGTVQREAPSVVLDRLQDAGNVGTILRSAAAFGFTQVIALEDTAALWSPKVLRAAMGAHFALNLVERMPAGLDASPCRCGDQLAPAPCGRQRPLRGLRVADRPRRSGGPTSWFGAARPRAASATGGGSRLTPRSHVDLLYESASRRLG